PPGTLLVGTRHQLLALGGPEPQILRGSLKHAAALEAHVEGGSLFWGDPSEGRIYRESWGFWGGFGGSPGDGGAPPRFLYWSDWGSRPQITRGAQDGGDPPKALVSDGVERPLGLALDPSSRRLFWADGRLQAVSSVGLDGSDRRTHLRDPRHLGQPLGLAALGGETPGTPGIGERPPG
ncbi:low-density lipoprotein receptor-like, partial [Passer montanus]|uniref:low-density lipoprotein receptor-like n=1 Tax=Passer montanus TaxID=9160 RepID=UPI00196205EB